MPRAGRSPRAPRARPIDFDIELDQAAVIGEPGLLRPVRARTHLLDPRARPARRASSRPARSRGVVDGDPVAAGLARDVLRLPEVVEDAAASRGDASASPPYATELATTFHAFYRDRRVVDPADPDTSASRLALVDVTRLALRNALGLLGISAPESM